MYEILRQNPKNVPKHISQYIQQSAHVNQKSKKKSPVRFDSSKLKISKKISLYKRQKHPNRIDYSKLFSVMLIKKKRLIYSALPPPPNKH